MPAHHRLGRHERQVLTPAGAPSPSQYLQELVPGAKPSTWSRSSGTSQDSKLVGQQQVLEHQLPMRAGRAQPHAEQQPEQVEHAFSIAEVRSRGDLPFPCPQTMADPLPSMATIAAIPSLREIVF